MKLTPRTKKFLVLAVLVVVMIGLTGCSVPRDENNNVILITNSTTFSDIMKDESWFSAIFVWPLSWCINHLAPVISVGGAIAVVTIVVNGVLAIATLKSTIATQQMQMIQPELEKIQRKYEGRDDESSKMRQAQEMQALYKKYNINPAGTLLVTFIQLPIIMAMYMAVQRAEAVQTGTFLGMNLQTTILDGAGKGQYIFIALFIFMAVCQFLSMKIPMILQKKRAEEAAAKHHRRVETSDNKQTKIMQIYMMGMILIFGLMWPAAMSLYWGINSCVNIVKTLLVQTYIDKKQKEGAKK